MAKSGVQNTIRLKQGPSFYLKDYVPQEMLYVPVQDGSRRGNEKKRTLGVYLKAAYRGMMTSWHVSD